jgi:small subunit ribosomal protein S9
MSEGAGSTAAVEAVPVVIPGAKIVGNALTATGRRKESVARVRLLPGTGNFKINNRTFEDYFPREALRLAIRTPLVLTRELGKYDVFVNVDGGGLTGQAGAAKMGIARALALIDEAHRVALRAAGLLTRDSRMKERKKYGLKKARKRFQWTKR